MQQRTALVNRGQCFVFLPFLYDEEAAAIRETNQGFLSLHENILGQTLRAIAFQN
jgi:hypothetical protein